MRSKTRRARHHKGTRFPFALALQKFRQRKQQQTQRVLLPVTLHPRRSCGPTDTSGSSATSRPRTWRPESLESGSPSTWRRRCASGWTTEVRSLIPLMSINGHFTDGLADPQEATWGWRSACTVPVTPSTPTATSSTTRTRCWKWSLKVGVAKLRYCSICWGITIGKKLECTFSFFYATSKAPDWSWFSDVAFSPPKRYCLKKNKTKSFTYFL